MSSHRSVFKSSFITGSSQFVVMGINLVKTKTLAILLGPEGSGLIGLYTSTIGLIANIANMGLRGSAIKEIAKAQTSGNTIVIGKILFVYRIWLFSSSFLFAILMFLFAKILSQYTFQNDYHDTAFQWLSLVLIFTAISEGQYTLLRGLRKVKELALSQIIGVLIGTVTSIIAIYYLGENGIIAFLLIGAFCAILISWWFVKRENLPSIRTTLHEFKEKSYSLFSLGLAFFISGLMINAVGYFSRIMLVRYFDDATLGYYNAAWTLSSVYIGFVLTAMANDFYPRLVGIINEKNKAIQIINDQIESGLLLSGTGIFLIIAFPEAFLKLFYAKSFLKTAPILQWMALGMAVKAISWPMGFIILAKGKSKLYMFSELFWGSTYLGILYFAMQTKNLEFLGITFFITYIIYTILIYFLAVRIISFKINLQCLKISAFFIIMWLIAFAINRFIEDPLSHYVNCFLLICLILVIKKQFEKILGNSIWALIKNKFKS